MDKQHEGRAEHHSTRGEAAEMGLLLEALEDSADLGCDNNKCQCQSISNNHTDTEASTERVEDLLARLAVERHLATLKDLDHHLGAHLEHR